MSVSEMQDAIRHLQETMPGFTARINFSQEGLCLSKTFYDIDMLIDGKVIYTSAYCHTLDEALNHIRTLREYALDSDLCEYCGDKLDGEVCWNTDCIVNREAA